MNKKADSADPRGNNSARAIASQSPSDPAPDDPGLSLDELGAAFAEMLTTGHDPYAAAPADTSQVVIDAEQVSPHLHTDEFSGADEPDDDGCELSPRSILESMLFVGHPNNEPLTSTQVASLMRGVRSEEIDDLVRDLNEQYLRDGCPYTIVSQGPGYCLSLRDEFTGLRDKFHGRLRQARLSPAALEVLALVAYNQPLTSEDVTRLRGRTSGPILAQLVRRQLLRIERPQATPRAARYFTTPRFLKLFGLEDLDDLPRGQEAAPR